VPDKATQPAKITLRVMYDDRISAACRNYKLEGWLGLLGRRMLMEKINA